MHVVWPGRPYPLGAHYDGAGVNFALYSQHAHSIKLLLFDSAEDDEPATVLELPDKTGPVWHGYVPGLEPGQLYAYRVYGAFDPEVGHRFNSRKVLLDPYARQIGRRLEWHPSLFGHSVKPRTRDTVANLLDSAPYAPLGEVIDNTFDWEGEQRLDIPWEDTIIYETHVKGLTKLHPNVPQQLRGTYLGLASEAIINHLKRIGVTAVQLLPVHATSTEGHLVDKQLTNYWGYNTLAYFAPRPEYAFEPQNAVTEFKGMVKALHKAGLEVLLDVVYNHTGEGNQLGPTLSFRGIDNASYYKLSPENPRYYMDYTGTGNTLDFGNPYVLQLTTDSLRYWVEEMHVDGFRFDLASAMARELYDVNMLSAFFKIIQQDPVLSRVKLIAEPWDIGHDGYQVGNFPWHWAEWNGRYRDSVRSYWRGEANYVGELATRVAGSSDLYSHSGRKPYASINFLTAHDGYTLHDLVSFEQKHNHANGENNRDGHGDNRSNNFGIEGETDDPKINALRDSAKRSLLATLFLSQGVPMLLGGDELSKTQHGNNNAYAQDNDINWYDWQLDNREESFLAFVEQLSALRREHPIFRRRSFLTGRPGANVCKDVTWYHRSGREMTLKDWRKRDERVLGMLLCGSAFYEVNARGEILGDDSFLVLFHGSKRRVFTLPDCPDANRWRNVLATARVKGDVFEPGSRVRLEPYGLSVFKGVS